MRRSTSGTTRITGGCTPPTGNHHPSTAQRPAFSRQKGASLFNPPERTIPVHQPSPYPPSPPSDPALFLWAAHLGRTTHTTSSSPFDRGLAGVGPLIEQYIRGGYRSGEVLPVMTTLGILDLSLTAKPGLSPSDGRRALLTVWEGLRELYGVHQDPRAVVGSRAALILALNALLSTEDPPPAVEMYVSVLDAELATLDWRILGQVSPERALQIEQIEEDWRSCAAEEMEDMDESISDTPEDRVA